MWKVSDMYIAQNKRSGCAVAYMNLQSTHFIERSNNVFLVFDMIQKMERFQRNCCGMWC